MERYITLRDGSHLFVDIHGQGKPLVLLHGNGGNSDDFKDHIEGFSKYFTTISIDTRGHGKSDPAEYDLTFEDLAEDLVDVLDVLKLVKVNVLGFSDGANLALIFAKHHPERIEKLILNSPNKNLREVKVLPRLANYVLYYGAQVLSVVFPQFKNNVHVYHLLFSDLDLNWRDYRKFNFDVLIIAGEKDIIFTDAYHKLVDSIPGAKLKIIRKQGHNLLRTNPKTFRKLVLDFLR